MISLKKILRHINDKEGFTFVSVGANDGIFVDEVFQSNLLNVNWKCFFIEPVKETFDRLIKNYDEHYPNNCFVFENYAIHTEDGEGYLVTNKIDDSRGMCSFFREESAETEKFKVTKKTFKSFVLKNNIDKIDFLKIDCEGMDNEIILQCFECGIMPDLILFEDISLDISESKIRDIHYLIKELNKRDDYVLMEDIPEYQYEESNKLIIKKELLKYV
jgi:FkbM family methyltransferase